MIVATPSPAQDPLKYIAGAAREVGLTRHQVARLIDRRIIPHVEIGGRVMVRASDVRKAIVAVPATA